MHHGTSLARLSKNRDDDFIKSFVTDYARCDLNDRERALCDYAAKLTRTPTQMTIDDLQPMRDAGLSDRDILEANLITAYYAFVNRIADGLGVPLDEYMKKIAAPGLL